MLILINSKTKETVTIMRFNSSKKPTIGVEVELQLINPWTLDLAPASEEILKEFVGERQVSLEVHRSVIEVNSEIASSVKECYNSLKNKLLEVSVVADKLGLKVSTAGTHPFQKWAHRLVTSHDRYQYMYKKYQWLIRRMNVYGMHVHIGVESGDKAIMITSSMIRYLPHLLALSASSPYWQGIDTGVKSSRVSVMESFPHSGIPPIFPSWKSFVDYYHIMKKTGAIESLKDLYWHVRPNNYYGTIELRICDAMTKTEETMAVTALIQCLIVSIDEDINVGKSIFSEEERWIAPENNWIAAKDGLNGLIITNMKGHRKRISEEIEALIEKLLPIAYQLNCSEELLYLRVMLEQGNGADRQRIIYKETQSHQALVSHLIQEFHRSP